MNDIDLLEDVAPASNELGAVADLAQRMSDLESEINKLEESLKQRKQDLKMLAEQDLPDLMQELNIKNFTLSNGAKVEVKDVITGSVPSQGAIDRAKDDDKIELELLQQRCFDWLRDNGLGELIKSNVEVQFGRDEDEKCNAFTEELRNKKLYYKRAVGVHPQSLNATLKERLSEGKDVPVDLFRVYMGRRASIRR
jgi:predicted nuclease with TOPRIM domain|tara:strand:+ start:522 stop:1109 length:588 start_codon:yes stop_codon:yes gene_type:complete